ncbi:MAG: PDZ domain-containing protein [Chitinophagaceae bacterium]|nr:PDZ domain-containing protein [Chitinophagaceae bacterium]
MNTKILPLLLLTLGTATGINAQTREKAEKSENKKQESITIRKKGDSKEKTTIVIDGDQITVNGKPLEDLKDGDIEVLRNRSFEPLVRLRSRVAPMGGVKMFGDAFPFNSDRAFLGVSSAKDDKGAKVNSVEKESAAEKAGLKKDDIITRIGDSKIEGSDDLYDAIGKYKPEDKVNITYLRDGKEMHATATLGKSNTFARSFRFNSEDLGDNFRNFRMPSMPRMDGMEFSFNRKPRLGLEIQDQSDGKGVKILDVDDESASAKAGLQKDDVITEIDGKAISSVDELRSKVRELKEGDSVKITYQRAGKTQTATVSFPKKLKTAEL